MNRTDSRGGCPYVDLADARGIWRARFKLKAKS